MASCSSIAPSENKAYCFRVLGLVVDGGTTVLRHQFDSCIPEHDLQNKLNEPAIRIILTDLKNKKKVLNITQWDTLYPQISAGNTVNSQQFDVALLNLLLRYVCGIDPSSPYWSYGIPPSFDTSLVADISRLRRIRNEFAHKKTISLSRQEFEQKWNELEGVILRLGKGIPDLAQSIKNLKTCSIDPEVETKYMAELELWKQNELDLQTDIEDTKEQLGEVSKNIETVAKTVDQQTSRLDNVTQQVADLEKNFKCTEERQNEVIKSVTARQDNFEENLTEERNLREKQYVGTGRRIDALEDKVEQIQDQPLRHMQGLADLCIEDNERDQLYVETTAYNQAKEKLLNSGIVILSGAPGEGKTMLATKLISEIGGTGSCLKLNRPSDMNMIDLQSRTQDIIFIDDIFGAGTLDENLLYEWSLRFPDLLRLVRGGKMKRKLIITSRHYILTEAQQRVSSKLFDKRNVVTIASAQLTAQEMTQILENHLRYFNRDMDKWYVEKIVKKYSEKHFFKRPFECVGKVGRYFSSVKWETIKTMTGFPETVRLFVTNDDLFEKGYEFFDKPYLFFSNCLEELFKQEEEFFALFMIWSMPGQTLKRSHFQEPGVNRILAQGRIAEASKWFGFQKRGEQMFKLLGKSLSYNINGLLTYHQDSGEYSFCHNIAKDMVGVVTGKQYPSVILDLANNDFLLQYTTVDENKDDDIHVYIETFRFEELLEAIVRAIKSKDVDYVWGFIGIRTKEHDRLYDKMYLGSYEINVSMLKHDCFTNESFLMLFCNSEEGRDLLFQPITTVTGKLRNCGIDLGDEEIPVYLASRALLVGNSKLIESFMKFHWKKFGDKRNFLYMSLLIAVRVGSLDTVELLLRYGAEPTEESLYLATISNHKQIVEKLLEDYQTDCESYDRIVKNNSPLIAATKNSFSDIAMLLLKHGFNVNYKNVNYKTALDKALIPEKYDMCEFKYTYRPVWRGFPGNDKHTCRYIAFTEDRFHLCNVLIDNGAQFDERCGRYKRTLLHTAADIGHAKLVKLLIEKGASLNKKDYRGHSPIHCAVIRGHCAVVKEILNADRTQISSRLTSHGSKSFIKGMTLLHIAVWKNKYDMVQLLLEQNADPNIQDSYGRTPFYCAAYLSHVNICQLLGKHSNVHQPDKNGLTPLHASVFKGYRHIHKHVIYHISCDAYKEIAPVIFDEIDGKERAAANRLQPIKGRNVDVMFALERAIYSDNEDECEHLLRNGADKNYNTGYFKRTPLHFAADVGSLKTTQLLINHGASLQAKDCRGYMPIHCAVIRGNNEVVNLLLQADPSQASVKLPPCGNFRKMTMDFYRMAVLVWNEGLIDILIQHGVCPNIQDKFGKTPLNVAAEKGASTMVKQLIPVTDVNLADNNGHTPLHTAIHRSRTDIAMMLCPVSNVNLQDKYGDTPLHKACRLLNFDVFKILIETCDARIDICNHAGKSVIDILDGRRFADKMIKFDLNLFLVGSNPFLAQDKYYRIIVEKKYSDSLRDNHSD